jgi:predicted  nucleic acid-binding Zn-ribbon protein
LGAVEATAADSKDHDGNEGAAASIDADEEAFKAAISAANVASPPPSSETVLSPTTISPPAADQEQSSTATGVGARHLGRQPSVSLQSKIRSTSFRDNGPLSPAALSGNPVARIEELERENRRLARESEEHEKRWRRVEEELEEVREENATKSVGSDADGEIRRLRAEIEALRRRTSTTAAVSRRESSADDASIETLKGDLERKDSTIADMQLEISRLRRQLSSQTEGCETHGEQIAALQASLSSTEAKLGKLETELSDTKKALSKASEKAVLDGTERTSKDTKIRTLERELQEAVAQRDELVKKAEQLDKKVEAMNKLHREAESRHASKLAAAEASARELPALRAKIERAESENARLREKHKRVMSGDAGGEGLDELEDEERQKLERRIRELEGEVFDLRRGVWRDKRVALQPRGDEGESRTSLDPAGAEDFDEVDLTGSGNASSRRRSFANQHAQQRHSNFAQVLNSGLAAFRASTASPGTQQTRPRNDSLLQEFDDDTFDENAFAHAQREEEARKMVEHVREVKRGLKQWAGWRLDLVDARRAGVGVGFGDIFDV